MEVHPDCTPISFLLGTWKGTGSGEYPTIEPFAYNEEVVFGHVGKPFLAYSQKTRHAVTGQPLHAETGYLRAIADGSAEFVVVQPSGIVESHRGRIEGTVLNLSLDFVRTTATAKAVVDVRRSLTVASIAGQQIMSYDVAMAAVGLPLTHHLHAELTKQPH